LAPLAEADAPPVVDFSSPFSEDSVIPRWVKRVLLQRRYNEDGALTRMAREISRGIQPDVLMVLLPGIDRIQHYLWGVMEPAEEYPPGLQPSPEEREGGKRALFSYYEYTDALIGALLEDYGPDDLVIVLSDHGFEAGHAYMTLTGTHESGKAIHGVVFMRGPGIPAGTRTKQLSVNDITPTILTWMGLPLSQEMDGTPVPFLGVEPVPPVPRYEIGDIEYLETNEGISGVESEIVEDLRALGYIQD
jgi:predicted AlkP superfamily phosphohydrolase/phosphomutase